MSKIQDLPQPALALVVFNNVGLMTQRTLHHPFEDAGLATKDGVEITLEVRDHRRVHDRAILDDLREALAKLALRQRRQRLHVGENQSRLVERADEILRAPMIHAAL